MSILKKILEVDPNKRLTPEQILQDPWMQQTEKQLKEVVVFNDNEKKKIVDEFKYYIKKKEGDNKDDPFLEVEL